jgi:hypothetical protein
MVSLVTICVRFSVTSIPSISTVTSILMPKMSKSPIISIICVSISICFSFGHWFRCGIYKNNGKYKAQSDQIKLKIEKNYNYLRISHSMRQHQQMQLKIEKIENYLGAFIICTRIGVFLCFSFGHRLRCGIYKNNGKYKAQSDQITLKIEKNYNYLRISHSMHQHQKMQGTKQSNAAEN